MKKQLLISILLFWGAFSGYSQGLYNLATLDDDDNEEYSSNLIDSFYAGISVGIPSGSLSDFSSFTYGAVAGYKFDISKRLGIAPEIDYTHFVGKDFDAGGITFESEGFDFVSVSARGDYALTNRFGLGANIGYGTYLEENSDFEGYFSVGLRWNPIPGLQIRPEIVFREDDGQEYRLRVQRTF